MIVGHVWHDSGEPSWRLIVSEEAAELLYFVPKG